MGIVLNLLLFVYFFTALYHLPPALASVYFLISFTGFFLLRFLLCPACSKYEDGCSLNWNSIGRFFGIDSCSRNRFSFLMKAAIFYWTFFFLFPLFYFPYLVFLLTIIGFFQYLNCSKCKIKYECPFGKIFGGRDGKKTGT